LEGEDEVNDTTVEDCHVSPKFERLQELVSMPNKDHSSREKTCRRNSQQ
jgi:hypothetical protein